MPGKQYARTIARSHRVTTCDNCEKLYHIKRGQSTVREWKPNANWNCPQCLIKSLPFANDLDSSADSWDEYLDMNTCLHNDKIDPLGEMSHTRQQYRNQELLLHYNINSLQNKFEETKIINEKLKATVIVLSYSIQYAELPNFS